MSRQVKCGISRHAIAPLSDSVPVTGYPSEVQSQTLELLSGAAARRGSAIDLDPVPVYTVRQEPCIAIGAQERRNPCGFDQGSIA
jgi:hypothetical protein